MPFSLSAKPPKPKPKKPKDRVVVRTGRGGAAVYKKKPVTPTPAPVQDPAPIAPSSSSVHSSAVASASGPSTAPTSGGTGGGTSLVHNGSTSQLSRIATSLKSSSNNSATISDGGETEDRIRAPAGREILSAKHRKIYSGRGGAGNAHKLLAEEVVYERVLLHEQGIVQAYNAERKELQGRSTGRGGSGNIKRKKKRPNGTSTTGSSSIYSGDGSSIRSSSTKSWSSSYRNRYRQALADANANKDGAGLNVNALGSLRLSGSGLGLTDDGDFVGLGLDANSFATSGAMPTTIGRTNTVRDSNVTTTTMTTVSLSPIPSLHSLPTSDFASALGMMDRGVFDKVMEEDETEFGGLEDSSQLSQSQLQGQSPVRVVVSPDPMMTASGSREMQIQQSRYPMKPTPTTHLSTAYGNYASRGAGVVTINHTSDHPSEVGASAAPSPSPVPSLLQQHPQLQHLHQQFPPSPIPSTSGNSPSPSSVGLHQTQSPSPSIIASPALSSSASVLSPISHSPVPHSSSSSPPPTLPVLRNAHSNKPVMSSNTNSITSRIKAGLQFVSGGSGKKSSHGSGNGLSESMSQSSIDSSSSFGTGVVPSSSFSHGGAVPTTSSGAAGKGKGPARSETPVLDIRNTSPSSLPYLDGYQDTGGVDAVPSSVGKVRRANSANALNSFASSSSMTPIQMAMYVNSAPSHASGSSSTQPPIARERAMSAGNAANRTVAVYSNNVPMSSHLEDSLTMFSVYSQQPHHQRQQSPSVINSGASTPRSLSSLGHRSQQGYASPELVGNKTLGTVTPTNMYAVDRHSELPLASTGPPNRLSPLPHATAQTRNGDVGHSRQMSSSSASGSDLDLSKYSFPDAPGHQPVVVGRRKDYVEPLQVIVESMGSPNGSVEGSMIRRGSEPITRLELHGHSHKFASNIDNTTNYNNPNVPPPPPPPLASLPSLPLSKSAGRAPVQPGAYQAGLRAVMEETTVIPDGTPPPYQPRASTRRYVDPSMSDSPPAEDDLEPLTPTSYGYGTPTVVGSPTIVSSPAYRVTSPHRPTMVVNNPRLDTSPNALRRPNTKGHIPSSPLSEMYTSDNGTGGRTSPVEQYYPTDPKAEKMQHQRTGSNRRPSDPYQRILAAAAVSKSNSPTPSRRGSSSQGQSLSPLSANGFPSSGSSDAVDENDVKSRPPSQAFSTYTRGTRFSTWGGSQATATAVDHHDHDFPNGLDEDDGVFYTSELGDLNGFDPQEKNKSIKEHLMAKENSLLTSPPAQPLPSTPPSNRNPRSSSLSKDPSWQSRYSPSPPVPPMPKHLLAAVKQQQQIFAQQQQQLQQQQQQQQQQHQQPQATMGRSTPMGRQLPTPPVGLPPLPPIMQHPHFPGGMGWDELNRPVPRKLSKMEKALLRRVEFGAVGAADIAAIPLA